MLLQQPQIFYAPELICKLTVAIKGMTVIGFTPSIKVRASLPGEIKQMVLGTVKVSCSLLSVLHTLQPMYNMSSVALHQIARLMLVWKLATHLYVTA